MKSGSIMLIYKEDVIDVKAYHKVWYRKEIIKEWAEIYKRQWSECALQIIPSIDYQMVNLDGTNKTQRQHYKDKIINHVCS